jgi:hypothetical protein
MTDVDSLLFNPSPFEGKDEKEIDILFQQYKLYVEMMDKVSERRNTANSFFVSANSLLITILAGIIAVDREIDRTVWLAIPAIAGFLIAFNWVRIIQSYRDLNTHKFTIIHALEKRLPVRMYDAEWQVAEQGKTSSYRPLSHVERWIPYIFMVLYALIAVAAFLGRV